MRSPVSSMVLGECNAIKSWGFGHSELTFAGNLKPEFGNETTVAILDG
jgi:hypothetical protein